MGMVARKASPAGATGGKAAGGDALQDPLTKSAIGAQAGGDLGPLYGDLLERAANQAGATAALFSLTLPRRGVPAGSA